MRKTLKTIVVCVFVAALVFLGVRFGPMIYSLITGNQAIRWESQRLSEELLKANEMVVQKWEVKGEETVTKEVNFVIFSTSTQRIRIPYTFTMEFKVDLSKAKVEVEDGTILVRIPSPYGANPKLLVDEDRVRKSDFFDPVSNQQYSEYKRQLEDRLFEEACANPENVSQAWHNTVDDIETLYQSIVSSTDQLVEVKVIRDDTLSTNVEKPMISEQTNARKGL